ncbi:hypothetical protein AAKU64_001884 [Undibacterium sp. GrIS 1.8]
MIDLIHQSKNIFKKIFKSSLLAGINQFCKFSLTQIFHWNSDKCAFGGLTG